MIVPTTVRMCGQCEHWDRERAWLVPPDAAGQPHPWAAVSVAACLSVESDVMGRNVAYPVTDRPCFRPRPPG